MTATMTQYQLNEIAMFGCTREQLQRDVESGVFLFEGKRSQRDIAMMAMSIMSDCQEMLQCGNEDSMTVEDVRQALNRAKWIISNYFMKGDVVSILLESNQFIFALAFEREDDEIDGGNRFIFSSLISDSQISIEEFLNSEIMYLDIGGEYNYHRGYFWAQFQASNMKRKIKKTKVIGNISFDDYLVLSHTVQFGNWNKIQELYDEQKEFNKKSDTGMPHKILMKDFIQVENKEFGLLLVEHANQLWKEQLIKIKAI
jgi:hypothetical protein